MKGIEVGVVLATAAGNGSLLAATVVSALVTALAVGAVYWLGWRTPPEPSFEGARTDTAAAGEGAAVPVARGGPMYESAVAEAETESVDHDAFDPVGTAALLAVYFLVVTLTWLFMYFVEFLANGPTVVG
ncbi:halocyanin [Halosimplex amylolyticum]|uniref:halocyanin n=1 Tax=Halosimplex amylolyticum TaxID=3396616 RepID=UPI003F56AE6C